MDIFDKKKRSQVMANVRGKDTKPELAVRHFLHSRGLRYRLHQPNLPGRPDLVLPSRRIVIFVHGCFWHQHPGCRKAQLPTTQPDFWRKKLEANTVRDIQALHLLSEAGWKPIVIWECEIRPDELERLYRKILAEPIR